MAEHDWSKAEPWELMDHIVATHHAFMARQMPLVATLLTEHTRTYWLRFPQLLKAHTVFFSVWAALTQHFLREETTAVPLLAARRDDASVSLDGFIGNMDDHEAEHAQALATFAELRSVLWDYQVPEGMGQEVADTFARLAAIEADLTEHIHLENDVLFDLVRALPAGN